MKRKKELYAEIERLSQLCKELAAQNFRVGDEVITTDKIIFGKLNPNSYTYETHETKQLMNAEEARNVKGKIIELHSDGILVELKPFNETVEIMLHPLAIKRLI